MRGSRFDQRFPLGRALALKQWWASNQNTELLNLAALALVWYAHMMTFRHLLHNSWSFLDFVPALVEVFVSAVPHKGVALEKWNGCGTLIYGGTRRPGWGVGNFAVRSDGPAMWQSVGTRNGALPVRGCRISWEKGVRRWVLRTWDLFSWCFWFTQGALGMWGKTGSFTNWRIWFTKHDSLVVKACQNHRNLPRNVRDPVTLSYCTQLWNLSPGSSS